MMRKSKIYVTILGIFLLTGCGIKNEISKIPFRPTNQPPSLNVPVPGENEPDVSVFATDLRVPWEIVFLPSGKILVTERGGSVVVINASGAVEKRLTVEGVTQIGEGGLHGMALHPQFENNGFVYLYLTSRSSGVLENRVERYVFENEELTSREVIIDGIPANQYHNGGRIAFGPDGYLYVATGDAQNSALAQDTNSLAGKILRLTDAGKAVSGNPFGNEVYSYGHRNPQGLTWSADGKLWATEHGRSGVQSGYDELNIIEMGANYGWPTIEGPESRQGLITPYLQSGSDVTWAPAGLTYFDNKLYFSGLRGQSLYVVSDLDCEGESCSPQIEAAFHQKYGRLRLAKLGPDGYLYIGSSNHDGRGNVQADDDKIIKVKLQAL